MIDALGEITTAITVAGVTAWRNRLPATFQNTAAACFVVQTNDAHHLSGATRECMYTVRVFGGSNKQADCLTAVNLIVPALRMYSGDGVSIIGELSTQDIPPEPDTGWPAMEIRFTARVKRA